MAATQVLASQLKDADITAADIAAANIDGSAATASMRTLGTGSQQAAAGNHTHAAADITSGTIATARLGSGTANSTTVLYGDQTYKTPSGGGVTTGYVLALQQGGVFP